MDAAKKGFTPQWMIGVGVLAAVLSALDLVIGFSKNADIHSKLREKFADLEIEIINGPHSGDLWLEYQKRRLAIEKDEPATYFVIDGLCQNELLVADGFSPKNDISHFAKINAFQKMTGQFIRWENTMNF